VLGARAAHRPREFRPLPERGLDLPGTHVEIDPRPALVPLVVIALAVLLWRLRRRGALTWPRIVVSAVLAVYVVVFLPLGVLLPLVGQVSSARRVLLLGFLLSLTMELLQGLNAVTVHGGHIADVNDLLANTLGAPLGYGVLRLARLVPALRRWADAATWPSRSHDEPELQPAPVDS
jgi:hypothetical protein